jgi:hypothetical protein
VPVPRQLLGGAGGTSMLTNTPEIASALSGTDTNRGRQKRASLRAAPAPAVVSEAKADWAPLWIAPFFCTSEGYTRPMWKWKSALHDEVCQIVSQMDERPPNPAYADLSRDSIPEFRIERGAKGDPSICITAMGITTHVAPGSIFVNPNRDLVWGVDTIWPISGSSDEILRNPEWEEVSPDERLAARWHRQLLEDLFGSLHSNFVKAVRSGAAHIMARKNSVLAPFERVTWDQWQFFRLDVQPPRTLEVPAWCDPREPFWSRHAGISITAIGPTGERLYAIYIAPGVDNAESSNSEETSVEKCLQWLLKLLHEYPDRAPEPLRGLADRAISRFPGLSKRAFERCYFSAQAQTGNRNWSRARRPRKSPA